MSSILTNNSAMVALQTLKGINKDLAQTQGEISTGKSVASSKDNAAVWAIAKVMESDVQGFKTISDSLALGQSTVAVARNAAESVTDLLKEMKTKITSAQESNVDREKLQTDVEALTEQIKSVVGSAQFNGLNFLNGSTTDATEILSSLDRDSAGNVTANSISVAAQDLRVGGTNSTNTAAVGTVGAGATVGAAFTFQGGGAALPASDVTVDNDNLDEIIAGDVITITVGDKTASYTIAEGDDDAAIDAAVGAALTDAGITNVVYTAGTVENDTAGDLEIGIQVARGGLGELSGFDVTTDQGAKDALTSIEGLIQKSVNAASEFGSVERRIDIQNEFVGKLMNSMNAGIGTLVDADMEEASARLKALQVQQQLGTQALSIANQAPQSLLSLFR
ncbi:flagellin [Rhodovulum imhoffii]|uniref:Flagellin n=1 Tax=Rhodovulum imhoffii TaxID=365340 RepID=A0A2T5BSE2_9RHOB|nr:flagellin [Rhodovulum imhoffii]MBK5933514.1 flagellin [Rhodovulum imhoffii]PTN02250.1 flagellin [Rhodovulum imhoffii]